MDYRKGKIGLGLVLMAAIALIGAACASGVPQADFDAVKSQLGTKETELAQLQKQLASSAPSTVVQTGQLQPAPAGAQPSGWDTAESIRSGLKLLATYDSSGPDAWSAKDHPLVYIASEGAGYGHRPSTTNKLPGLQIIDATTKKVITSAQFDLGLKEHGTPHGLGISPDGKWLYVATGEGAHAMTSAAGTARLLIVNARTLKLDKILTTENLGGVSGAFTIRGFHHMTAFKDWQGRDRVLVQDQSTTRWILDPKDNHRVVKAITLAEVGPMGHPYSTVDPTGKFLYVSMSSGPIRSAGGLAGVAKVNLDTGAVTQMLGMHAGNPIGIVHTADGKFTYVADGHGSLVYKIDNATNQIVANANAGVAGPYGLTLNWDETELWTMGKGEGTHNTGGVVGIIDTKIFSATNKINQPVNIGGAIIDHGILHPDPVVNEIWVSSAGTWETIVVDVATKQVKARIPSPHGGDTHSGGFARYNPDFTGELLADMGGPQREMYATRKANVAKAAAAAK